MAKTDSNPKRQKALRHREIVNAPVAYRPAEATQTRPRGFRFTDTFLKTIKIPKGRREVIQFETGTGLGVRASRNQITFIVQTRLKDGRRWRETLKPWGAITIEDARSIAQQRSADAARGGEDGDLFQKHANQIAAARMSETARKLTLRVLADRWNDEWLSQKRQGYALRAYQRVLIHFASLIDKPAAALTKPEIREALEATREGSGPAAARNAAASLRALYRWGLSEDLIAADPLNGLKLPQRNADRARTLDIGEARRIWGAAATLDYPAQHFVKLLMLSGARRSEISALQWSEIKVDGEGLRSIELSAERTKNKTAHDIPLSGEALRVLADCQRHRIVGSKFVLTSDGRRSFANFNRVKLWLDKALAEQGEPVANWRLHDFRRCIVSTLAAKPFRYDSAVLDQLLGHVVSKLTAVGRIYQREQHLDLRREALHAWAEHLTAPQAEIVALPGLSKDAPASRRATGARRKG